MKYIHLRKRMINEERIMGRLFEKLRNKMKEGKKIEMLLRQNKFEPFSEQDIIDRFEYFDNKTK